MENTSTHYLPVSGLYTDSRPILNFKTNSPNGHQSLPNLIFQSENNQFEVTILHSCNGLMLCSRSSDFIVCNLTTKKFKIIPSFYDPFPRIDVDKFIVFNPITSPHYKVVLLSIYVVDLDELFNTSDTMCCYRVDIYSSDSGTWKKILFDHLGTYPFTKKVLCGRSIYWMDEESKLLQFNIDDEKLKIIQLPSQPPTICGNRILWFGEYGGRLFLAQAISTINFGVRVLEMNMDNFNWNIKYDIDLGLTINTLFGELELSDLWGFHVLCLMGTNDQENLMLVLAIGEKMFSYNLNSNRADILQGLLGDVHGNTSGGIIRVHKFIESMASV